MITGSVATGRPLARCAPDRTTLARLARRVLPALLLVGAAAGCTTSDPQARMDTRLWTDDLAFRVRLTPRPPYAREDVIVRVVVTDKKTGAPVENGEGRIFASSKDSVNIYDGLERGPEPGTYYAKLRFLTAGEWAMGLQFRRDSTQKLQTLNDPPWLQIIRNAR